MVASTITVQVWASIKLDLPIDPPMEAFGYIALGIGVFFLLLALILAGKHRPLFLAAFSLLSYYPLAYALHWYLFNYEGRQAREPNRVERFLDEHLEGTDLGLLITCCVLAFLFLIRWVYRLTRRPESWRREVEDEHYEVAPRPRAVPPPVPPQPRTPGKKPPPPPASDNPFQFR
jgi:hypothetical protein